MISREWMEPAIAVAEEEWHRGRVADPTVAPGDVPDLSQVTGYTLDDVRFNCVGSQSPAQRRLWRKTLLWTSFGLGIGWAFTVFWLHAIGFQLVPVLSLIITAAATIKALVDAVDAWGSSVSQVDGDATTELIRDSESPDEYFVHIEGLRLEITKAAYRALVPGGPYRIFYLRGPKQAVGGQVLPGWRPLPQPERKKRWWDRFNVELSG